jgi:hypothetical protein
LPNDANQTIIGANGSVYFAPVGTVIPINPTVAPAAAWLDVGFLNQDGLQYTLSKETTDFQAWQSLYDIRTVINRLNLMLGMTMLQWNAVTLPLALGGGAVTTASPGLFKFEPAEPGAIDERAAIFRWKDGSKNYQWSIPRVMVVEDTEFGVNRTSMSELPITLKTLASGTVKPYSFLTDDPALNPA